MSAFNVNRIGIIVTVVGIYAVIVALFAYSQISMLQENANTLATEKNYLLSQVTALSTDKANLESQITTLSTDKANLESQVITLHNEIHELQLSMTYGAFVLERKKLITIE